MSITKHIPNTITSLNMLSGVAGILFAFYGHLDWAFYAMLGAVVFDFCDGFAARLLNSVSKIGIELDSLADLISFAFLPATMLHCLMRECSFSSSWTIYIPFLLVIAGGLRLAKFNIDERQTDGFLGLPTPIAALLSAALCYYICFEPVSFLAPWVAGELFVPVLVVALCALELCEIPMFSLKFHKDDSKTLKNKRIAMLLIILVAAVICFIFGYNWSFIVVVSSTCYILKNIVYAILKI